jgi:tetratricopeptide (TPR) repeat protein
MVAHHRLALCAKAARNPRNAIQHLEFVEKRAPEFEKTRLLLGQLYLQIHRTEEGKRLLQEYETQRKSAQKHSRIGLIVSMNPKSADAHWQMALLYKEENDTPRMIVELRKTLELKANHAHAKRLLEETARAGGQRS